MGRSLSYLIMYLCGVCVGGGGGGVCYVCACAHVKSVVFSSMQY